MKRVESDTVINSYKLKKNWNIYIFSLILMLRIQVYPHVDWQTEKYFNLYWIIGQNSHHRFNFLDKLLNRDLAAKIDQAIPYHD